MKTRQGERKLSLMRCKSLKRYDIDRTLIEDGIFSRKRKKKEILKLIQKGVLKFTIMHKRTNRT